MTLLATLRTVVRLVLLTVGAVCLGFGRYDVAVFALSAGAALVLFDPLAMPAAGWWGYWLVIDLGPAGWAAFYDGGTPSASPRSLIPQ